jgi:ferrous iron transport protein B
MPITLALAGNPNCGKTTIFNALTGARRHVGNWPGVTVERRSGFCEGPGGQVEVVDLPGTYSLSAQSEDERIAARYVADPAVDVIVNVLDAGNLERNLYLTTQLLELRRPMVYALNMMDDAEAAGLKLDLEALEQRLGGPVIPTVGNRREGIQALREAAVRVAGKPGRAPRAVNYGHDLEGELVKIEREIQRDEELAPACPPRWLALQLLERVPAAWRLVERSHARKAVSAQVQSSLGFLEPHLGADGATLVAERRYGFAHGLAAEVLSRSARTRADFTARLDALLTHRWLGIPIFVAIMIAVYTLTFVVGRIPQDWIAGGFGLLQAWAGGRLPPGEFTSLLVDGIIPGVGAVVVFVPIIMLLMGCIAFLEDTGYMSRAAFIMDRLMHLMGLHGKSFIPLIMGTGCNVPAVQATRTIEAREDRLITILVTPLMSCSARLQIYIVIAGTFFRPVQAAFAILAMHALGFALAMAVGKLLRLTLFRGAGAPFVMELPPYRLPVLKSALIHMWEKGAVFLTRAGTTILAGATLIWFLSHYPGISNRSWSEDLRRQEAAVRTLGLPPAEESGRLDELSMAHRSRVVNTSLAASIGKALQPALAPILDPDGKRPEAWKDSVALTAGFVAKEIVVSTMAVIHHAREDRDDGAGGLGAALRDRSGLTPLTALAFMVFTLIYTPCLGTVGMILKETGSLLWTGFSLVYGLGLAWLMAWFTVLGGQALGFA